MENALAPKQRVSVQPERLPIKVVFVLNSLQDTVSPLVNPVREYCLQNLIFIECREYDSHRYQLDRDEIVRLPACHMFIEGAWKGTFYLNTRPYQIIEDAMYNYKKKREERLAKKTRFREFWKSILRRLRDLGKRKTRMERTMREWK